MLGKCAGWQVEGAQETPVLGVTTPDTFARRRRVRQTATTTARTKPCPFPFSLASVQFNLFCSMGYENLLNVNAELNERACLWRKQE